MKKSSKIILIYFLSMIFLIIFIGIPSRAYLMHKLKLMNLDPYESFGAGNNSDLDKIYSLLNVRGLTHDYPLHDLSGVGLPVAQSIAHKRIDSIKSLLASNLDIQNYYVSLTKFGIDLTGKTPVEIRDIVNKYHCAYFFSRELAIYFIGDKTNLDKYTRIMSDLEAINCDVGLAYDLRITMRKNNLEFQKKLQSIDLEISKKMGLTLKNNIERSPPNIKTIALNDKKIAAYVLTMNSQELYKLIKSSGCPRELPFLVSHTFVRDTRNPERFRIH